MTRAARIHLAFGVAACLILPLASKVEGSGTFAWTMFASSGAYRIEITARDDAGVARHVNPTALAEHAAPNAGMFLAGTDHWRSGPSVSSLRAHIRDLTLYACRETGAVSIELTLFERLHGHERTTSRRERCPR